MWPCGSASPRAALVSDVKIAPKAEALKSLKITPKELADGNHALRENVGLKKVRLEDQSDPKE
jgi:hypothetical protein